MDATYATPLVQRRSAAISLGAAFASLGPFVFDVLKAAACGDDFERASSSPPGAEFAALSRGSRQRHLNRGFRP
jgi:hypothetical protein